MEVLQEKTRTAAKLHRCDYCYGIIEKGDSYNNSTLVADGEIWTWKSHVHCQELALKLNMFAECYGEGLTADDFQETITEEYRKIVGLQGILDVSFQERLKKVKEKYL